MVRPVSLLACASLLLLLAAPTAAAGQARPGPGGGAPHAVDDALAAALDLGFVANGGQLDERVRFTLRHGALTTHLTDDGLVVGVLEGGAAEGAAVAFTFEGDGERRRPRGLDAAPGAVHVYRRDVAATALPRFARVRYDDVGDGVDIEVRAPGGQLEYDLLLAPGADLAAVAVRCDGAVALRVADDGRLLVETEGGVLAQSIPATWEIGPDGERVPRAARFRLLDERRFGFEVDGRDARAALVVDPDLTFGSYLGGTNRDEALTVTLGADGRAYVAGLTGSASFPVTPGAFQRSQLGITDAFVACVDLDAGAIEWATFLGGTDTFILNSDRAADVAVDGAGNVYVTGWARNDFPTTSGAYAETPAGDVEGFVAKFGPTGTLAWSTLLGGTGRDFARAVVVTGGGDVVVAGHTFSDDFPVSAGAYDESFGSIFFTDDAFVARLSADGSALVWSTFLGGSLTEEIADVVLGGGDEVYVTGLTRSADYPATRGAYDEAFSSGTPNESDAFVAKLSSDGATLAWSTFLGGVGDVAGAGIDLGPDGTVVVAGRTASSDFPTTRNAVQTMHGGGTDAFVTRLAADGSGLLWSSMLGGSGDEAAAALAVDGVGAATVAGWTTSTDLPAGQTTHDASANGGEDAFVARLDATGAKLLYASYHGGGGDDAALGLALDGFGAAVIAGRSGSADLPVTAGAFQPTAGGDGDGFVARLAVPPWIDRGYAQAGTGGVVPRLVGTGTLEPLAPGQITLTGALPASVCIVFAGLFENPVPFKQGVLVPVPWLLDVTLPTFGGTLPLAFAEWPEGMPPGFALYFQVAIADAGAPGAVSMSNALQAITP